MTITLISVSAPSNCDASLSHTNILWICSIKVSISRPQELCANYCPHIDKITSDVSASRYKQFHLSPSSRTEPATSLCSALDEGQLSSVPCRVQRVQMAQLPPCYHLDGTGLMIYCASFVLLIETIASFSVLHG